MVKKYRVECARPGLERAPGLVSDFDDQEAARAEAHAVKASRPDCRVTITTGDAVHPDEQPAERRHPHGHHWLTDETVGVEVIDGV